MINSKSSALLPNHLGFPPEEAFIIAKPVIEKTSTIASDSTDTTKTISVQTKATKISVGTQTEAPFPTIILKANSSRFEGKNLPKTTPSFLGCPVLQSGFELGGKVFRNVTIELFTCGIITLLSTIQLYFLSQVKN